MIPTAYKDRLPKHLSYPVHAGELSDALASVPLFGELSVSFHRHAGTRASGFDEAVRSGKPYPILVAQYMRTPLGLSESNDYSSRGYYGPAWTLWVYPVPRAIAGTARAQLATQGLPAVRAWLNQKRSETWLDKSHEYVVRFSTSRAALVLADSAAI